MDISTEVAAIQAASEGSELRQPLVDALDKLNSGTLPAVSASDEGKILKVGANGWEIGEKSGYMPVPSASLNISTNNTYDVTNYAEAVVDVQPSGKINITQNGTDIDVANYALADVTVSGGATLVQKTITQNGTYDPADDNADGYSEMIVSVSTPLVIYNNSRTLAAYIDQANSRIVWYFMGFEKNSADVAIPSEMLIGQSGLFYSKAYGSDKETQIGQIGFYNEKIRSWSTDTAQTIAGTFWGVVYSNGGTGQTNPYTDPPQ